MRSKSNGAKLRKRPHMMWCNGAECVESCAFIIFLFSELNAIEYWYSACRMLYAGDGFLYCRRRIRAGDKRRVCDCERQRNHLPGRASPRKSSHGRGGHGRGSRRGGRSLQVLEYEKSTVQDVSFAATVVYCADVISRWYDASFICISLRTSGVTDHYAENDEHAIKIARSIVANLNWKESQVMTEYDDIIWRGTRMYMPLLRQILVTLTLLLLLLLPPLLLPPLPLPPPLLPATIITSSTY